MLAITKQTKPWQLQVADWRRRCREQYQAGAARRQVLHDLVDESIEAMPAGATVLDIGCGKGFDGESALQESLARSAGSFLGVEPDPSFHAPDYFTAAYCTTLERAPIAGGSVDVAYAVFVLEHVARPEPFWSALFDVLSPGGVFWGFTVDARNYFSVASRLLQRMNAKEWYLDRLYGRRGEDRYETFPTCYLANTPRAVCRHTSRFSRREFLSLHRVGQVAPYFPRPLRPFSRWVDRAIIRLGLPGSILCMRLQK